MASSSYSRSNSDSELISNTISILYTPEQLQKLEELFLECNRPNNNLIEQWSLDLTMEPDQIKYWFRNRMLQKQAEDDEAENMALRLENERLVVDNTRLMEQMSQRTPCPSCVTPVLQELIMKNVELREEYEKVSNFLGRILEDPVRFELQVAEAAYNRNLDLQFRLAPPSSTEPSTEASSETSEN